MRFSTAAALLFGLATRIGLNKFYYRRVEIDAVEPSTGDVVLLGLCQGVALYYVLMDYPEFVLVLAAVIAAHLVISFILTQNVPRCATTLLGIALGVLVTDVLSQLIEDGYFYDTNVPPDSTSDYSSVQMPPKRRRLVKFQRSTAEEEEEEVIETQRFQVRSRSGQPVPRRWSTDVSTPSLSSSSDAIDPNHTMTPLEREVAGLRARAALADGERRRFREEKKWAISQGNLARASQMGWQVKRYTALAQSFNREADARLIENAALRSQQRPLPVPRPPLGERRRTQSQSMPTRPPSQEIVVDRNSIVTVDVPRHHRRKSSGNLKSAIRVQVK